MFSQNPALIWCHWLDLCTLLSESVEVLAQILFLSGCMRSTNLQGVYPGSKDLDEDNFLASFLGWTHSPNQSKLWLAETKFTLFMSLRSCAGTATPVRTEKKIHPWNAITMLICHQPSIPPPTHSCSRCNWLYRGAFLPKELVSLNRRSALALSVKGLH